MTFGAAKPVHLLPAGEPATGQLTVVDIGLDFDVAPPAVERLTHADVAALWPVPTAADHKYSRGVVGIVTGSTAYPGAAVLSVLGALGVGPGMVRYLGPAPVETLVHHHAPEAVTAAGQVQAWVLGSGVATAEPACADQVERIQEALGSGLPAVVDAGALDLVTRRAAPTVLTPHAGELAALLKRFDVRPDGVEAVSRQSVTAAPLPHARAAADVLDAVVLLKGATTLSSCRRPAEPARCAHRPTGRRGWPPRAPATSSAAPSAPCLRPGWTRSTPRRWLPSSTGSQRERANARWPPARQGGRRQPAGHDCRAAAGWLTPHRPPNVKKFCNCMNFLTFGGRSELL